MDLLAGLCFYNLLGHCWQCLCDLLRRLSWSFLGTCWRGWVRVDIPSDSNCSSEQVSYAAVEEDCTSGLVTKKEKKKKKKLKCLLYWRGEGGFSDSVRDKGEESSDFDQKATTIHSEVNIQTCVSVRLYVEPVLRSTDCIRSWKKIGSVVWLHTPASPSMPEMEGMYAPLKDILFWRCAFGGVYVPCIYLQAREGESGLCNCCVPCLLSTINILLFVDFSHGYTTSLPSSLKRQSRV